MYLSMVLVSIGCSSFFQVQCQLEHKLWTVRQNEKECTNAKYILRNKYKFKKDMTISHHVSIERF